LSNSRFASTARLAKQKRPPEGDLCYLARPAGIEPATPGLEVRPRRFQNQILTFIFKNLKKMIVSENTSLLQVFAPEWLHIGHTEQEHGTFDHFNNGI